MSVCFFSKLVGSALFTLEITLLCVECLWQETVIGQVRAGVLQLQICKFSANRKQMRVISVNIKSFPCGKNCHTIPTYTSDLCFDVISIRAQFIP